MKKMQFLDHGNTITERHLNAWKVSKYVPHSNQKKTPYSDTFQAVINASKLHLNKRSTQVLSHIFVEAIFNITNLQFVLHSLASDNKKNRNTNDYDENKAKFKVGAITASILKAICIRNINRLIIGATKYKFPEK